LTVKEKLENFEKIDLGNSVISFVSTSPPERLKIEYYFNRNTREVIASVIFGDLAQGPPGYAHGGAIAAVLDETMGIFAWANNFKVLTTELITRYFKAVKLNKLVFAEVKIKEKNNSELTITAELTDENGETLYAQAEAKFAVLDNEKWKSIGINTEIFNPDNYL